MAEIDADPAIRPNFATTRTEKGDFSTKIARNLGITPEQRPWLFVVKKNKTVLTRLLGWIRNHVANTHDRETGRRIVTNLPLLLIDDEADHASVDTREMAFDENGRPDEEHEPTAINRLVRRILHSFSRSACVGYTATPFANIFIHEQAATREEGPDLFPAAFIVNLAAPSNYVGPARVFGARAEAGRSSGLPVVRQVTDFEGWMPTKHKNGHFPLHEGRNELPPSLNEAIDAFILACALRRLRGQEAEHCSMLVHVTSSIKMRTARDLELSFSGGLSETVNFHREPVILQRNLEVSRRLVASLGTPETNPSRPRNGSVHAWEGYLWNDVSADDVTGFLDGYRGHPEARKANSALLAEFIRSLISSGELTRWAVALIGGGEGQAVPFGGGITVQALRRAAHGQHPDRYSIRRLMSPRDEAIDLDEAAWVQALDETRRAFRADPGRNERRDEPDAPNGPAIRKVRPKERGVLFLYAVDPALAGPDAGLPADAPPVIGFAVSFPASETGVRVRYRVNNIYWEQEYGCAN